MRRRMLRRLGCKAQRLPASLLRCAGLASPAYVLVGFIRKAVVSGLLVAGFWSSTTNACSRAGGPPSSEETIAEADEIFVAHLVSATEIEFPLDGNEQIDSPLVKGIEGRYQLIESLKGTTLQSGVVHDFPLAPGNCSLGLMPGWDYVFFVKRDAEHPEYRWVGMFTGSMPLGPYREKGNEEPVLIELKALITKNQIKK